MEKLIGVDGSVAIGGSRDGECCGVVIEVACVIQLEACREGRDAILMIDIKEHCDRTE
jgi:hypothetical protein